ncbi:MAG: glycosyltransferase family 39 protein, partial [Anaerolineae bacterium]|nr:glycosyltransferase family 39 protein [Anaerolineae bacterium]
MNSRTVAILALALVVRLLGIGSRPIWYDEAFAILFSQKGLNAMLYGTLAPTGAGSADIHPLGYYTLLWLWMQLFGDSLFAVRLLSILAGLVSVYLIYLIALEA